MPSSFERVAVGLGIMGLACLSLGAGTKTQWLSWLGFSLGAPLLLGALVALVVGLPMGLLERRERCARRSGGQVKIIVTSGDLVEQQVDCIVNAWNRNLFPWWLLLPQGVSKAIKGKAGLQPFRELRRHGLIPLGGAVLTGPGKLAVKGIIHVAGIGLSWRASEGSIRCSVRNAMRIALAHEYRSVAFPLIGAGTGGLPPAESERIMLNELTNVEYDGEVRVVVWNPAPSRKV